MRVSEYYKLGRDQPVLDFVDVDIYGDLRVFVDPKALRLLPSPWGAECVALVQDFFRHVLDLISQQRDCEARRLLSQLREPNEVHPGLSRARSRGTALGRKSARDVWGALRRSEAATTGLLEDLEDTILMIENISDDRVSDMTINIIREPLIRYTHQMAELYGIPMVEDVNSGPLWDLAEKTWYSQYVSLPVPRGGKLVLVPKSIVRKKMTYDVGEYFTHYILESLREEELNANSELVRLLKNGTPRVTKEDLKKKYGTGKSVVAEQTLRKPQLLRDYRKDKSERIRPPLSHSDLAVEEATARPDWDALLAAVLDAPVGKPGAKKYERAIVDFLTALFYPSLTSPDVQTRLHGGRKIVDATFTNMATDGFFGWLANHQPSSFIFVECKNYHEDPANPELDQLSGRFSPRRGKVGLLVCRNLADKELMLRRCRDTANDERGFVIPLDDSDLAELVREVSSEPLPAYKLLRERFSALVL